MQAAFCFFPYMDSTAAEIPPNKHLLLQNVLLGFTWTSDHKTNDNLHLKGTFLPTRRFLLHTRNQTTTWSSESNLEMKFHMQSILLCGFAKRSEDTWCSNPKMQHAVRRSGGIFTKRRQPGLRKHRRTQVLRFSSPHRFRGPVWVNRPAARQSTLSAFPGWSRPVQTGRGLPVQQLTPWDRSTTPGPKTAWTQEKLPDRTGRPRLRVVVRNQTVSFWKLQQR